MHNSSPAGVVVSTSSVRVVSPLFDGEVFFGIGPSAALHVPSATINAEEPTSWLRAYEPTMPSSLTAVTP